MGLNRIQGRSPRHTPRDAGGPVSLIVCAFYFSLLLSSQTFPVMVGPYDSWEECTKVREWRDWRAYETDDCESFPYPQGGSQRVIVPYLPKEGTLIASPSELLE